MIQGQLTEKSGRLTDRGDIFAVASAFQHFPEAEKPMSLQNMTIKYFLYNLFI